MRSNRVSLSVFGLPKYVAKVETPSVVSILISLMSNGNVMPIIKIKCSTVMRLNKPFSIFPTRYHIENHVQVKAIKKILRYEMSRNLFPFRINGTTYRPERTSGMSNGTMMCRPTLTRKYIERPPKITPKYG